MELLLYIYGDLIKDSELGVHARDRRTPFGWVSQLIDRTRLLTACRQETT